jgi:hypothetical protein
MSKFLAVKVFKALCKIVHSVQECITRAEQSTPLHYGLVNVRKPPFLSNRHHPSEILLYCLGVCVSWRIFLQFIIWSSTL